ncbi:flagellar basal-body MS-ring/collar protein FliF [Gracilibacillus marinus]|jgi:flagellar M-ring protein FliF|uniref:Flagellar M-ring protein n=1 Tax=Gracilibacillus marinus TaxID=630535 RepID=A0ABV8VV07_9BACI
MNETIKKYIRVSKEKYQSLSKLQKGTIFGSLGIILILIIGISIFASNKNFVPLYSDLTIQEVGQIKAELDAKGVQYELINGGTTIQVPEAQAQSLLVDLASQGIPKSGSIDYSFFSENSSWGVTDNEFDVMKLDAMQSELANLIAQIEGIDSAEVSLTIPKDPVFVSEQKQDSSAAIVIQTQPGYQFEPNQINALYHLVSKSVPNLSTDNIVIMNQNFEYFDLNDENTLASSESYASQQQIKQDIEQDIERQVQRMLGMMIGMDKVAISATADIDFTQEQRVEQLVEPVNEETDTLPVSIETITESFTGAQPENGAVGTEEGDTPNYPAGLDGNVGDYEMVKESVNNEFNRIQRDIVESPYKIRDLGIQVAIDNTRTGENGEVEQLAPAEQVAVEESVASILDSIIQTTIDKSYGNVVPGENVSIVFQPFNGVDNTTENVVTTTIPIYVYIALALLVVIIIVLILLLRKRKKVTEEEVEEETVISEEVPAMVMNDDSDDTKRRKQLEKYAQEKPEDFAKLLRSWISED